MNYKSKLKYQLVRIGQIGTGKLFGITDAILNQPYSTSIKCFSTTGTCLRIQSNTLIKAMEENDNSVVINIKNHPEEDIQGLARYLNRNKEFEDSSKYIFRNFGDKIENMEDENFSPFKTRKQSSLLRSINKRYDSENQSLEKSKDGSTSSLQKRIPYTKVQPLNFKSSGEIRKSRITRNETIPIHNQDILRQVTTQNIKLNYILF